MTDLAGTMLNLPTTNLKMPPGNAGAYKTPEVVEATAVTSSTMKGDPPMCFSYVRRLPFRIPVIIAFLLATGAAGAQPTWDFETGNLRGWTKTGTAFDNQPTFGNNIQARGGGAFFLQGNFFVGTHENRSNSRMTAGGIQGDEPQGTLTSDIFPLNMRVITFLIGCGF